MEAAAGLSSGADATGQKKHKRPKYSKFTQQELSACKPIITPQWVISVFALVGVIFIPIGVVTLLASRQVVEIVYHYEDSCLPNPNWDKVSKLSYIQNRTTDKSCTASLKVPKDMNGPIYVYYQLSNLFRNHRRYVKSRSDEQLHGINKASTTKNCEPERWENGALVVPCGLIAWSLFNDTYSFKRGDKNLDVNKTDIAWRSDKNHKFGKNVFPKNFQTGPLIGGGQLDPNRPLSVQEDLIVWMRTAALPTFRKLYGRIEVGLKENDSIIVNLMNNYNTYSFDGEKKLVLSTSTWIGGKNDFLGVAYLVVGGLCFLLAVAFTLLYLVKPRKLGDPSYLSWNRNPDGY